MTVLGDSISTFIELKNESTDSLQCQNSKVITLTNEGNPEPPVPVSEISNNVQSDVKEEETDIGPLKCDMCDRTFKLESALRTHLIKHGRKLQFKCKVCGKEFTCKSSLSPSIKILQFFFFQ